MDHVDNAQSAIKSNTGQWTSLYTWWHGYIKHRPPVSWPWTAEDGCLGSLDLTAVFSDRELQVDIMVLEHSTSFLLNTGTTYLILRKFWGPTSPSCLPIVMVRGQLHLTSSDSTNQLHFQGHSSRSFMFVGTNPSCALTGKGSLCQSRSFYFFASPICLTPHQPEISLLPLITICPTASNMSFSLPSFQVDPKVWNTQNPSAAEYHFPIVIKLQDPLQYITQAQCPPLL